MIPSDNSSTPNKNFDIKENATLLQRIFCRRAFCSARGVSIAEFAVVAGAVFTLLIATVEFSYQAYVRNSVSAALSYAVKRAQSEPNALIELSEITDPSDPRYQAHLAARQAIAEEALAYLKKVGLDDQIKFQPFTYEDNFHRAPASSAALTSDQLPQKQTVPVAFLLPATSASYTDSSGVVHHISNSSVCPVDWTQGGSSLNASPNEKECPAGATVRNPNDSFKKLAAANPFDIQARYSTTSSLLQQEASAAVGGFDAGREGAAAIAADTATPTFASTRPPRATPTPEDTATSTPTPTWTPTSSATPTPHDTPTPTSTWTPTASATATPIDTATSTPTWTPTASATNTPRDTETSTPTPTWTPTASATNTPTWTATASPTVTPTWTPTASATSTPQPVICRDCLGDRIPDANGDCIAGRDDVQLILSYAALNGDQPYPGNAPAEVVARDINHDGRINAADATIVINYIDSGVCLPTPTPTETPISTRPPKTPTPTPTATATVTNTATPTSTPEVCPIFEVNIKYDGDYGVAQTIFERNADTPSCLDDIYARAQAVCSEFKGTFTGLSSSLKFNFIDDCIVGAFLLGDPVFFDLSYSCKQGSGFACIAESLAKQGINSPGDLPLKPATVGSRACEPWLGRQMCFNREATFYLDRNCRSFDRVPDGLKTCPAGTFHWRASPISLEWETGSSVDSSLSIVDFELDPNDGKRFYIWKGSAETPLLVYDPKHTGAIGSAEQLFGEWTFGGRPVVKTSTKGAARSGWGNGYEALASLDRNNDRKISGAELAALALWFDRNRDGVSQPGEVVPAERAGLTELRVDGLKKNSATGDLFVENGFSRMIDGKVVYGRSVDWYGEGGNNRLELINKYVSRDAFSPAKAPAAGAQRGTSPDKSAPNMNSMSSMEVTSSAAALQNKLSGVWSYRSVSEDSVGKATTGLLSFKMVTADRFVGHSMLETMVRDNRIGLSSVVQVLPLEGRVVSTRGDTVEIAFSVSSEDGMRIESSATVSSGKLVGKSTAHVKLGEQTAKIPYEWAALRRS